MKYVDHTDHINDLLLSTRMGMDFHEISELISFVLCGTSSDAQMKWKGSIHSLNIISIE